MDCKMYNKLLRTLSRHDLQDTLIYEMEDHFSNCADCQKAANKSSIFIDDNLDIIQIGVISSRLKELGIPSAEESWKELERKLKIKSKTLDFSLPFKIDSLISKSTSIAKQQKEVITNILLNIFKPPLIPKTKLRLHATRGEVTNTILEELTFMNLSQISFDQNAIQTELSIKVNPRTFDEKASLGFMNFPPSLENHHLCLFAILKEVLIEISADLKNLKALDYISQILENIYSKAAIIDLLIKVNGAKKSKIKKKRSKPEVCSVNFTFSLNDDFASVILGNEEGYQLLGIIL